MAGPIILQVNMTNIDVSVNVDVHLDPGAAFVETDAARPPVAPTTAGPHRYTIYVPNNDQSIVNVGQGVTGDTRIKDTGITGKTNSHIHWEVKGKANKTLVTLGGPATDSVLTAFDATVPTKSTGYAMVTDGPAWHDSKGQHYMVSRTADVIIRTHGEKKTAALHSDTGDISIAAGHKIAIGAKGEVWVGADVDGTVEDKKFEKVIDGEVGKWLANKAAKTVMTAADTYYSWAAVAAKAADVQKKAKDGKDGWETETNWSKAKFIIDIAKIASTVGRYATEFFVPGKVSIVATTFAGMTGNIAASIYGNLSASVTSVLSASLLGGTASVKGFLWTSVWSGIGTSIKSIKDVEVKADKGKTKVQAKKDVEISSETTTVKVTGEQFVQVNSVSQVVFIHGKVGTYMGAAGSEGYGAYALEKELSLGKFTSCGDFKNVSPVSEEGIMLSPDHHDFEHHGAKVTLKKGEMLLKAKKAYTMQTDGNAKIEAVKVLIG